MGSYVEKHRHQDVLDLVRSGAILEGQVQMLGGLAQGQLMSCASRTVFGPH